MVSDKKLPPGFWMNVQGLPHETKEAQVADHFCQSGIAISEDAVSCRNFRSGVSAIVSVPYEQIADLIAWTITQNDFMGSKIQPNLVKQFGHTFGTTVGTKR